MKSLFKRHSTLILVFLFFSIVGITYSYLAPPVFLAKSQVALFRPKLTDPEGDGEESKNRWIWVRDGLNLKSALVTDSLLLDFINKNNNNQERELRSPLDYLKSLIKIDFTGADENNYIIEVKSKKKAFALELNQLIFERLRYLVVEADQKNYEAVLAKLQKETIDLKPESDLFNLYQNKIQKIKINHIINQTQRERSFEIISPPTLLTRPIWPQKRSIIIVSMFLGFVFGLCLEFFCTYFKKNCHKE